MTMPYESLGHLRWQPVVVSNLYNMLTAQLVQVRNHIGSNGNDDFPSLKLKMIDVHILLGWTDKSLQPSGRVRPR